MHRQGARSQSCKQEGWRAAARANQGRKTPAFEPRHTTSRKPRTCPMGRKEIHERAIRDRKVTAPPATPTQEIEATGVGSVIPHHPTRSVARMRVTPRSGETRGRGGDEGGVGVSLDGYEWWAAEVCEADPRAAEKITADLTPSREACAVRGQRRVRCGRATGRRPGAGRCRCGLRSPRHGLARY